MKSHRIVSADVTIRIRKTGEEQNLQLDNIPCEWVWADGSMDGAEYWAVANWVTETFGHVIDWYTIKCIAGSPMKEVN